MPLLDSPSRSLSSAGARRAGATILIAAATGVVMLGAIDFLMRDHKSSIGPGPE